MHKKLINYFKYQSENLIKSFIKWIILGSIVGIAVGSVIALFLVTLDLVTETRLNNPWLLFLLPVGGAVISFIYANYGKASSKGNNLIIESVNDGNEDIPLRMAPLVFLGTITTHLFGGSAGREGTGVQIGSSIAYSISKLIKLDKFDKRLIIMCGISSGFSAVFGTPLAGTIFGLELSIIGKISYEALIPCMVAALVGDGVTQLFGIHHIKYTVESIPDFTIYSVLKVVFASILFGLISKLFSELTHYIKKTSSKIFKDPVRKSFIGGLIIIALTYIAQTRDYLGLSIPLIQQSFTSEVHPIAFLGKILFTSLTIGTGFQGGEVTPLFVIGSTLGNSISEILSLPPSFLSALGLIGVFAGATNAPLTSFILGVEMFGGQNIKFMFITCIISYLFSGNSGIYTSQRTNTDEFFNQQKNT